MNEGKVYIVGAGPGDPGLITVKARDVLRRADVLLYDRLANESFLSECKPGCEMVFVGKQPDRHAVPQHEINRLLVDYGKKGGIVVRLKGGDPYIFGRGGEEVEALVEAGVPFEVIPGVTSAIAALAYAGIPATHRDCTTSVTLVTGHEDPTKGESTTNWDKLATASGTIVIYMGVKNSSGIIEQIMAGGRSADTPAAIVSNGTLPSQSSFTATLGTLVQEMEKRKIKPPSLIVIGEVAALRDKLAWFEKRPLFGRSVLVTRSRTQASAMVARLDELGARVLEFPTIRIEQPEDFAPLDNTLKNASQFEHVVFTSVNGVESFFERAREINLDIRDLAGPRLWAIGPATRDALLKYGVLVEKLPMEYFAKSLAAAIGKDVSGARVLLPRVDIAPPDLRNDLEAAGAVVTEVVAYRTVPEPGAPQHVLDAVKNGEIDYATFTSSSTVRNFMTKVEGMDLDKFKENARIISIGPVTTETAKELGLEVHAEASEFTIPGLVDALLNDVQGNPA